LRRQLLISSTAYVASCSSPRREASIKASAIRVSVKDEHSGLAQSQNDLRVRENPIYTSPILWPLYLSASASGPCIRPRPVRPSQFPFGLAPSPYVQPAHRSEPLNYILRELAPNLHKERLMSSHLCSKKIKGFVTLSRWVLSPANLRCRHQKSRSCFKATLCSHQLHRRTREISQRLLGKLMCTGGDEKRTVCMYIHTSILLWYAVGQRGERLVSSQLLPAGLSGSPHQFHSHCLRVAISRNPTHCFPYFPYIFVTVIISFPWNTTARV
jgi:hypothetical protein